MGTRPYKIRVATHSRYSQKFVAKQRAACVNAWISKCMKYIGKLNPDTVDYPEGVAELQGDEILIEYHNLKVPRSQ